jgi:hypothetical protein
MLAGMSTLRSAQASSSLRVAAGSCRVTANTASRCRKARDDMTMHPDPHEELAAVRRCREARQAIDGLPAAWHCPISAAAIASAVAGRGINALNRVSR